AERLVALLDEIPSVLVLSQVGGDGNNLAPGCLGDFAGRGFKRLLAPRANRDVDAFFRQGQRDPLTDAFAAASDQRSLAFELEVHRSLPILNVAFVRARRHPPPR